MIEFLKEYIKFMLSRKKYWLIPIFLILLIIGVLIIATSSTALAPFIYTIF